MGQLKSFLLLTSGICTGLILVLAYVIAPIATTIVGIYIMLEIVQQFSTVDFHAVLSSPSVMPVKLLTIILLASSFARMFNKPAKSWIKRMIIKKH